MRPTFLPALLLAVFAPVASMGLLADTVFTGGAVYTLDARLPRASAVVVEGRRIVYVGDDAGALRHAGGGAERVDLRGRMLLPGFQDSHAHPGMVPNPATRLDVGGLRRREDILQRIRDYAAAHPDRPWITGTGWDEAAFLPGGQPTRAELDAAAGARPALLTNNSLHMAWVNSAALRAGGITRATPDPANGRIERDADGEAGGVLQEAAMDLVRRAMPPAPVEEQVADLLAAMRTMHRHGITAWIDAAVRPGAVPAYLALARDPAFAMRARICLYFDPAGDDAEQLARFRAWRAQFAGTRVDAGCVKIVEDGAFGSHTVALLEPYADEPARFGRGQLFVEPARLSRLVTRLDAEGFQLHVHTEGDRAARSALDAIAAARQTNGARDNRHTLAHLVLVDAADVPRLHALDVVANMSPLWGRPDPWGALFAPKLFGPERAARQYPVRTLLDAGARLAWGSDWPVSEVAPLDGIETATTRRHPGGRDAQGVEDAPLGANQRVSLAEALHAYTAGGAWLAHAETERGSIAPGRLADLVVLGRDLFSVDALAIHATTVELTMVDGEVVFRRGE